MKEKPDRRWISLLLAVFMIFTLTASTISSPNAALMGIDVSQYNGTIDWDRVAASGVAFSFVKAGSTNSGMDPAFVANVTGAKAAGIRTGVYLYSYATDVTSAVEEADLLLQWIAPYGITDPVAFDIENQENLDPETVTAICNAFCDTVAAAGYYPIVYTYRNFYARQLTTDLRYDTWIAQYNTSTCDISDCGIWQYSSEGRIPGIATSVDVNLMLKDYSSILQAAKEQKN